MTHSRRSFLHAPLLAGSAAAAEKRGEEVLLNEDLMREHGVLRRVLLIYEEVERRIARSRNFDPQTVAAAADIVRRFVEDYHEKQEEDFLFPRFRNANRLTELVDTLERQHKAGRAQTAVVAKLASPAALNLAPNRANLAEALQKFVRMYRPHAAREDTVLFPALHDIVSAKEYAALGERFEDRERKLFGGDGFEKMVARVAGLEKELGLYDLNQFTPS
jgi:hemerythrin-like domain-containing protein